MDIKQNEKDNQHCCNALLGEIIKPMTWNKIEDGLPLKEGFYECYIPESRIFREHHARYWFDGQNFRDGDSWRIWTDTTMYGKKINKYISHWMKIERPV